MTLNVRHEGVDVDAALNLHLLQHRVTQDVETHRTDAAAVKHFTLVIYDCSKVSDNGLDGFRIVAPMKHSLP